jgi:murein DD-endopeptidase MepM/ murein hydrolase activator NlpD
MGIETSKYGKRIDPFINEEAFHSGIDIASVEGKNVHSSRWGRIVYAGESDPFGNLVAIEHELGYYTLYGHLQEILVEIDENVESGQVIGKVGSTGKTTGPHLHFEIRREKNILNPDNIPYFLTPASTAGR